jgi:hypothetical protein
MPEVETGQSHQVDAQPVDAQPADADALAASARREKLSASYGGEWVAVSRDWSRLYAHGASYLAVCAGAVAQGARNPLIARFP